jgi:hypothetical protein
MLRRMPQERPRSVRTPHLSELPTFALAVEEGSLACAADRLSIAGTAAAKRTRKLDTYGRREQGVVPASRPYAGRASHHAENGASGAMLDELGVSAEGHTPLGVLTNTPVVHTGVHIAAIARPANRAPKEVDLQAERIRIGERDCILISVRHDGSGGCSFAVSPQPLVESPAERFSLA